MASVAQVSFIRSLAQKRDLTLELSAQVADCETLTSADASRLIDALKEAPLVPSPTLAALEPGMYQREGVIYRVQEAKQSGRLYAKRLVECGGDRLRDADEAVVHFEFEYANGAIYNLAPEHRMTTDEARAFGIRYGICCVCAAPLKDAESVALGIGPVCRKRV